jgi:GNAT superfamily N-acetyltransferase
MAHVRMSNEVTICPGRLTDVRELAVLMERYWAFEGIDAFDSERTALLLGQLLSQPHLGTVWTARVGGRLVGYLAAVFVFSFEYQGLVAEVDEFFVLPQARSRGSALRFWTPRRAALLKVAAPGCNCSLAPPIKLRAPFIAAAATVSALITSS